jgi:putative membrane protein
VRAAFLLLIALTASAVAWSYPDESFYKALMEGGIAEIDAANLALDKSANVKVKEFASMIIMDHTLSNNRLKALAALRRARLPSSASAAQQAIHAKLALVSGRLFDQLYIRDQIDTHQELLDRVNDEMASGKDAKAKAFAQEILPTLETHLKLIRVLAAGEGV